MWWTNDYASEFERLRSEMDNIFNRFDRSGGCTRTYPLVNLYDSQESIIVTAEVSGIPKDKIAITFADGFLTISGTKQQQPFVKDMTLIRQERSMGKFEKNIRIKHKILSDKISAQYTDGIITITLPKSEEAKPKTIAINI